MQDCQHAKLSNDRSLVVKRVGLKHYVSQRIKSVFLRREKSARKWRRRSVKMLRYETSLYYIIIIII